MGNHPNRHKVRDWPEFIKEFRAIHDLTQKSLADMLQVSKRNVENWESGSNKPPAYLKKALKEIGESL